MCSLKGKKVNTRFNPFNRYYEVYTWDEGLKVTRVYHEFFELKDAVTCKRNLERHQKLFDESEEDQILELV